MLAIVDPVCFAPYSSATLAQGALGGTEATVVRIAEGLGATVFQHNRTADEGRYRPLACLDAPSGLVVLRDPRAAVEIASRFPGVPLFVWMHDLVEPGKDRAKRLLQYRSALAAARATIVAVSEFHRAQIQAVLDADPAADVAPGLPVVCIHNPLRPGLGAGPRAAVDPDQLIYFSAASKGLDYALFVFQAIRRRWPTMRLLVASPGYVQESTRVVTGVVRLGALEQSVVLDHVSRSLCTFSPNFEYPETFGLVLAESNAVGTPVLAHPIGAAAEVLGVGAQILPLPRAASLAFRACRRYGRGQRQVAAALDRIGAFESYLSRINAWRDGGRPVLSGRKDFELDRVLQRWRDVVGGTQRS